MKISWICALAAAVVAVFALPAHAQPVVAAKSGTIASLDGRVFLADVPVEASLTKFPDIKEGVVLRTELGRAEVLLPPGVVMHVGENSSFRMIDKRLVDTRLELLTGSAVIDAVDVGKETNVTVICKDATITLSKAGHYRIDADPARVKVFAGLLAVQVGGSEVTVSGGKMLSLTQSASVEKFDKEATDSLDNWAKRRLELMAMANLSAAKSAYSSWGTYQNTWGWNSYLGIYTFIPGSGRYCSPYYSGYCYWSPLTVGRVYYQPPPQRIDSGYGGGWSPSYPTMGSTSGGYSGTMSSSSGSVSAAPAAAASSGSSAASAAPTSSVGQGSGGAGGRGR
jgi:hypothetical protein